MDAVSILSYDDKDLNLSTNVALSMPSSIQGGSYFTKIYYEKRPLYMQSPKCVSRQGIITIGKKMYMELIISNEKDGEFISFLENLEKTCVDIIFEKRHIWFTDELEKTDIETAFASIIKSYKNGTSHLLKLNINNTNSHAKHGFGVGFGGIQTCFVFDENNNSLKFDNVNPETPLITIIEFEGIKFTSKSFQFEMNARQILLIDEKPIFNSCLIKPKKKDDSVEVHEKCSKNLETETMPSIVLNENGDGNNENGDGNNENGDGNNENGDGNNENGDGNNENDHSTNENGIKHCDVIATNNIDNVVDVKKDADTNISSIDANEEKQNLTKINQECLGKINEQEEEGAIVKCLETKTCQNENEKNNETCYNESELVEINLDIPQELDSEFEKIKLQNAHDVYYKMYKEAKEKAKSAKRIAVEAYLAAEEIKFTYNITDNESDSESESENESENESDNDEN
jgi:hypothetical protein